MLGLLILLVNCLVQLNALTLPQGALVDIKMDSTVGVFLEEFPTNVRGRVVTDLLNRPSSFWVTRAKYQIKMMQYRLTYRTFYHGGHKGPLPLIPENQQTITFRGLPSRRTIDGHDLVAVDYTLTGTMLTDLASLADSEPALDRNQGVWLEHFHLPVDPEQILQRIGSACHDEAEYPLHSLDAETTEFFFDQECKYEKKPYDGNGPCELCHCVPPYPTKDCTDALLDIGSVSTDLQFTRAAWDADRAAQVRALSNWTPVEGGADLLPLLTGRFKLVYRYFQAGSCERLECIYADGWRRLALFSNQDMNIGEKKLDIGAIAFDHSDSGNPLPLALHNQMIWDPCHQHYHFERFNDYTVTPGGSPVGVKQGFCIQNVIRQVNTEYSPVSNEFADCNHQGVSPGWTDIYNIGIPCQWYDISSLTQSGTLNSHVNFANLLCEGTPVLDASGNLIWDPTTLQSSLGGYVDKVRCNAIPGAFDNNIASAALTIPGPGEGAITGPCARPGHQFGPTKDCEFSLRASMRPCTPGQPATLQCSMTGSASKPPQIVRICESSITFNTGTACVYTERLASGIVQDTTLSLTFTCPSARDAVEVGGWFSIYTSPLVAGDNSPNVQCTLV
jgi:hypothetical protein